MAKISFKSVVPKDKFDYKIFYDQVDLGMRVCRKEIINLFDLTVQGWEEQPDFKGTITGSRGKYIRLFVEPVGKNAEIYKLVSLGSPPHPISARNAPNLVFRAGYMASTLPKSLSSRRKRRYGPVVVIPYLPRGHPGFGAREFDIQIAEKYTGRFYEVMARFIERAGVIQNQSMR